MSNISKTVTDATMGSMEVEYENTPGLSMIYGVMEDVCCFYATVSFIQYNGFYTDKL